MRILKQISRKLTGAEPAFAGGSARGKEQSRAYAIGDVHGRLDLLHHLLREIERDVAAREPRRTWIVFLGDLVDRGPDSRGVVERLRTWQPQGITPVFLTGNHEEVFLRILAGEGELIPSWLAFGGAECARSYEVEPHALATMEPRAAVELLRSRVPQSHVRFLSGFADTFRFGDYLFVHAGIRPGIAIEEQERQDLRWIREPFLTHARDHGFVVVHGHTITETIEERPNRIGIDTGAYHTGNLTALAIEDGRRWYLSTAARGAREAERSAA